MQFPLPSAPLHLQYAIALMEMHCLCSTITFSSTCVAYCIFHPWGLTKIQGKILLEIGQEVVLYWSRMCTSLLSRKRSFRCGSSPCIARNGVGAFPGTNLYILHSGLTPAHFVCLPGTGIALLLELDKFIESSFGQLTIFHKASICHQSESCAVSRCGTPLHAFMKPLSSVPLLQALHASSQQCFWINPTNEQWNIASILTPLSILHRPLPRTIYVDWIIPAPAFSSASADFV